MKLLIQTLDKNFTVYPEYIRMLIRWWYTTNKNFYNDVTLGNKENSIYQFYLNLSNLKRYSLGKHLRRNKEWKRDKSNTSKIHFEDKCVLLVCSAKFRKMRTRIYSAEWRIASKRRKRKKKRPNRSYILVRNGNTIDWWNRTYVVYGYE